MSVTREPGAARVERKSDIAAASGRRVVVVGTYRQVDVRMRQRPPAVFAGHVAVELSDGTNVYLEPIWSKAAIRGAEERARLDGKRVEATGVLHERAPEPPEPAATIVDPCLSPVESVRPAGG